MPLRRILFVLCSLPSLTSTVHTFHVDDGLNQSRMCRPRCPPQKKIIAFIFEFASHSPFAFYGKAHDDD